MLDVSPVRITADSSYIPTILELLQRAFAYMEPRINPPSSMHRLTVEKIKDHCVIGEVWAIGEPPKACVFFNTKGDHLYIGKLAVTEDMRGRGIAGQLIDLAEQRARSMGLSGLELQTRIELTENHVIFQRLGFTKTGENAHQGFDRPTSITMRKPVRGF